MKTRQSVLPYVGFALALSLACGLPFLAHTPPQESPTVFVSSSPIIPISGQPAPGLVATNTVVTSHLMVPANSAPAPGQLIYDVDSSGTGPEKRAPYGDSYQINRFERPFLKDMTYVPDLDILRFNLSHDTNWYYVSIKLVGNNPNNSLGINYGVEIDLNADGFGDYIIWAHPPYGPAWETGTVQVFKDSNHDTGGLSPVQSDASFNGNGYDTLVFDGGANQNADPDLAWVRINGGDEATIQFAFKQSFTGSSFMLGIVSDAGLKDVSKFDYSDRFQEADAGSSVRNKKYYPLGSLYAVDNTCWEEYSIKATVNELRACEVFVKPIHKPSSNGSSCDPNKCGGGPYDPSTCECQ